MRRLTRFPGGASKTARNPTQRFISFSRPRGQMGRADRKAMSGGFGEASASDPPAACDGRFPGRTREATDAAAERPRNFLRLKFFFPFSFVKAELLYRGTLSPPFCTPPYSFLSQAS